MSEYSIKINDYDIRIREYADGDPISEITELLHRAYKALADKGMNYLASFQDNETTLHRIRKAYRCYLAVAGDEIIATVSLYKPDTYNKNCWYGKEYVAKFGQFAVKPELQKLGIGGRLIDLLEHDAGMIPGITELALDTAETAAHLIEYYTKRGYRFIEYVNWDRVNYRSVILSKTIVK